MSAEIPETVTEHVRADALTPGRTIFVLTSTWAETVERVEVLDGYVNVYTDQTSCYQWQAHEPIRTLTGGAS
ncbi:hypothetical protein AB0M11_08275 [Streptomyces sp. NPDC051987]|uniref:hypothetical protein n=1 Tax=Streptomyces sp. NPDC051987 TaxID=3155808 RepID=UPI003446C146